MPYRAKVEEILSRAGVAVHVQEPATPVRAQQPWDICVRDARFFRKAFFGGSIGFGEAYMDGWWCCADLEELINRLLRADIHRIMRNAAGNFMLHAAGRFVNRQTRKGSMDVAHRHYNLDTDLFRFLGNRMNYSCGYFAGVSDLDTAQEKKLELICRKLDLSPGDRVADIGGGWGEFARYAASRYRCHVTSINIADNQIAFAREYCKGLPVDIVKCDYRDLDGMYDKIAAIAMVAHVGYKNYRSFMEKIHRHLAPNGIFIIETVGSDTSMLHCDPWLDKYIFPNGLTPSLKQLAGAMEGLFVIEDLHNFAPHYVQTLRAWNHNFQSRWPELAGRYPETVRRMFDYFFQMSAGAFKARYVQYWHLLMTKCGADQPRFRRAA